MRRLLCEFSRIRSKGRNEYFVYASHNTPVDLGEFTGISGEGVCVRGKRKLYEAFAETLVSYPDHSIFIINSDERPVSDKMFDFLLKLRKASKNRGLDAEGILAATALR